MAKAASKLSPGTVIRQAVLKKLNNNLPIAKFRLAWLLLNEGDKTNLSSLLSFAVNKANLPQFKVLADFASKHRPKTKLGSNILDPEKGVYSEIEYDSIKEQLRLATENLQKNCRNASDLHAFSQLIASQLPIALVRRPTQLVQLKWSDVLPVGQRFSDHHSLKRICT